MFDVRAYVLVIVVSLYLICSCLPGEEDEHIDHKEDKDENDDTDVQEREADQAEANRTCVDERLGPDLEFA
jgi:ABC-type nickel/cobalt efflux system permease component RcnA